MNASSRCYWPIIAGVEVSKTACRVQMFISISKRTVYWLVVDEDNLFIRPLTLDSKRIKLG